MIKVGISSCLIGHKVRYDGGHKASDFCQNDLNEFVEYLPLCPEIGIGLPIPRPSIRLEGLENGTTRALITKTGEDITSKLRDFADVRKHQLSELSGYVLCAKSPSCGLERVRLYTPGEKDNRKAGVGIFAQRLKELEPALPMEEDGRLNDPHLRENFVLRLFVYSEWKALPQPLKKKGVLAFHTRQKLLLLAHNQPEYRALGKRLGELEQLNESFAQDYIVQVMNALAKPASKANHTNVLQHVQGYFKTNLSTAEREALAQLILEYRAGLEPLSAPLTLFKHYLKLYPKDYLTGQSYFQPYPQSLRLRYGL